MNLLIIHCPNKPFSETVLTNGELSSLADNFEWCLCETNAIQAQYQSSGIGSIDSMPYADEVLVLMPTLDIRLMETKVPLVKPKKLQQVLPSLVEDEVLDGIDNSLVYALPPLPGQIGSQRTVAIMNRQWLHWVSNQLKGILTPRIRLIPDCMILPLESESSNVNGITSSCLAYKQNDQIIIYTWHKSTQLGISWVEHSNIKQLPSVLQKIQPTEWSWDWMISNAFNFSRRTDVGVAGINLLLAMPTPKRSIKKISFEWFKNPVPSLMGSSGRNTSWTDQNTWALPARWAIYAMGSIFLGLSIYTSWLAIDSWRWKRNMDLSAAQFLAPDTVALLTQSKGNTSVSEVFVKQATQEARNKGLPTDADFIAMTGKLQQLKTALGKESINSMEYNGYSIDFEFKPGGEPLSARQVISKAESLGLMVADLGNNRYRLQPYSGLGQI
jgi:Type II secretion system (T2SS), protein L